MFSINEQTRREQKLSLEKKIAIVPSRVADDILEVSMQKLEAEFALLVEQTQNESYYNSLSNQEKLLIENNKLAIMMKVRKSFEKQYGKPEENHNLAALQTPKPKFAWWRKILFGFLMVTDIALMTVGGYLGSIQLLSLIPHLSATAIKCIAVFSTSIEALMMYAMFKPMLQEGLGIASEPLAKATLAESYNKRINLLKGMNSLMVNKLYHTNKQGPVIYGYYANILKMFNDDMKKTKLLPYQEALPKKLLRYGLSLFNTALNLAGTYYGTVLLLTAVSPVLVGTPIGWSIIATVAVAQLLSRLFIRKNAVFHMLNPFAEKHEATRKKLNNFKNAKEGIDYDFSIMKKLHKLNKIDVLKKLTAPIPKKIKRNRSVECPDFFKPGEPLSEKMRRGILLQKRNKEKNYPLKFMEEFNCELDKLNDLEKMQRVQAKISDTQPRIISRSVEFPG